MTMLIPDSYYNKLSVQPIKVAILYFGLVRVSLYEGELPSLAITIESIRPWTWS